MKKRGHFKVFKTARTFSMRVVDAKIRAARQQAAAFSNRTAAKTGGAKNRFPAARQKTGVMTGTHRRAGILTLIKATMGKKAKTQTADSASGGSPATLIRYDTVKTSLEKGEIKPTAPFFCRLS